MGSSFSVTTIWMNVFLGIEKQLELHLSREAHITTTQYRILLELSDHNVPLRSSLLADQLLLKPSSVTCALVPLEQNGYIQKHDEPLDRRAVALSLTPQGKAFAQTISDSLAQLLDTLWRPLSQQEVDAIIESTRRVTEVLRSAEVADSSAHVQPYYVTAIVRTNRILTSLLKDTLHMSMTEFRILLALIDDPQNARGSDLARRLHLDTGIISVTTNRLCGMGLLVQKREGIDKRNRSFYLTDEGRARAGEAVALVSQRFAEMYENFSRHELEVLQKTSEVINANL